MQIRQRDARQIDLVGPRQASAATPAARRSRRAPGAVWPLPRRVSNEIGRAGVHAGQSGGRGCSTKCSAGQRAPSLAIAACGVSPAVKKP